VVALGGHLPPGADAREGRAAARGSYRPPSVALVVWDASTDLEAVVESLRKFGFTPLIRFGGESALPTLLRCRPSVAVVGGGCGDARLLLRSLAREAVPTIFIGTVEQMQTGRGLEGVGAAMLSPVDPFEIAQIARTMATDDEDPADVVEVGELSVDLARQIAIVDGEPVRLPPREFAILRELSLHVGEPISAADLIVRVWPRDAAVTPVDVARHVYRLRRLIGDNARPVPLVATRRGFGYCLEPRWSL
jgi:DNA-binding response OmpR family regulator